MNDILCRGDMRYLHHIRMRPIAFYALCKILSENNLLQETIHMSIKEQMLIFLHAIGHDVRFRVLVGGFIDQLRQCINTLGMSLELFCNYTNT